MKRKNRFLLFLLLVLAMALAAMPTFGAGLDDLVQEDKTETTKVALFNTDKPNVIKDQYIVVLKDATTARAVDSLVDRIALRGAKVDFVYGNAVKGFSANLPAQALDMLLKNDMVAYIEADQVVEIDVTWGLDRTDQRQLPLDNVFSPAGSFNGSGVGVHAYIVDTGVLLTHNEFSGRMGNGYDAVTSGGNANDCNGHGTHVAGTVAGTTYGLAPSATVHAVRVLDCGGSGTIAGVVAGVDWVANNYQAPAVANMSLGGGASATLDDAVSNAVNAGVTFVVAAGNDNADACNYSPARTDNAITVGSTTSSDARSSFSNYGTCVDVFAPGSSITSAWHTGDSATNTISGTSMASPHVAGAVALYLGNNAGVAPATVFNAITGNATENAISNVGSGSPNLLLFVGDSGPIPTPTPSPTPAPQTCTTYVSSDAPKSISSSGTPSVSSVVSVPSSATIVDVNILDLNGTHTWVGDLDFNLISPAGTEVQVITPACSSNDDFNLSLDDEAGSAMPCPPTGGGTHLPSNALSAFDGQDSAGTWTLRIDDNANLDGGSLNGWSLEICVPDDGNPNPTATPPAPTATPTTPPPTPTATTPPPTATPPPPTATPGPDTCTTYASSDLPKSISSSGTPSISSVLSVPANGTIVDVNILDLNGTHTWVGDLDFNLISPAGTEVQVIARACSSLDDFNLSLDDEAGSAMPCPPTGGGTHVPSNALSAFDGQNSAGNWTLRIDDNANLDGGSLNGWSLEICLSGS